FVNKKKRIKDEGKKRSYIEKYIPHVAAALQELIGLDEIKKKKIEDDLAEILEHTRGELEEIKVDNPDYDPELAKIGKEDKKKEEPVEEKKENKEEPESEKKEEKNDKVENKKKPGQQKLM
ncbi:hypothetical protein HOL59_04750, partial [Candidatus Woesearchaeota archaeon]|nr:hypothetical protein [Candidatus Woesearchaeota archaeon]